MLEAFRKEITDAGLEHLKGMTGLKDSNIRRPKVTDAGIAEFQKALPNCGIDL